MNFLENACKGSLMVAALIVALPVAGPIGMITVAGGVTSIATGSVMALVDEINK